MSNQSKGKIRAPSTRKFPYQEKGHLGTIPSRRENEISCPKRRGGGEEASVDVLIDVGGKGATFKRPLKTT